MLLVLRSMPSRSLIMHKLGEMSGRESCREFSNAPNILPLQEITPV